MCRSRGICDPPRSSGTYRNCCVGSDLLWRIPIWNSGRWRIRHKDRNLTGTHRSTARECHAEQPRILFATQATARPPTFVLFTTGFWRPGLGMPVARGKHDFLAVDAVGRLGTVVPISRSLLSRSVRPAMISEKMELEGLLGSVVAQRRIVDGVLKAERCSSDRCQMVDGAPRSSAGQRHRASIIDTDSTTGVS